MFIATYFQKVQEGAHGTEKPLGIAWILKFSHLPFFLPSRLVAVFYNIIEPLMAAVFGRLAYNPVGSVASVRTRYNFEKNRNTPDTLRH
jgi:hypothetical protein